MSVLAQRNNRPRSGHPSKSTSRPDCAMLKETGKNPRATAQTQQASAIMLNVKIVKINMARLEG